MAEMGTGGHGPIDFQVSLARNRRTTHPPGPNRARGHLARKGHSRRAAGPGFEFTVPCDLEIEHPPRFCAHCLALLRFGVIFVVAFGIFVPGPARGDTMA